jgi:ubiquinone/menaquinone biosynthesis C-methylase UbiE
MRDGPRPPVPTVKGQMDAWAPYYDFMMIFFCLGRERAIREMTVRQAGVGPGDKVLEVGCGTGTLLLKAKEIAGPGGEAVGLDAAEGMLRRTRSKASRAGIDVNSSTG